MTYIALLRGINVGGNNKVSMPSLKASFLAAGFKNVTTYINSGNVLFSAPKTDKEVLVRLCQKAIKDCSQLDINCTIITHQELTHALANAPSWWGDDPNAKHNAIFAIAPATVEQIMQDMGQIKPDYEKVYACDPIIYWTAPIKTFSRTRYSKIAGTEVYRSVTIRNANTTKKLKEMCDMYDNAA